VHLDGPLRQLELTPSRSIGSFAWLPSAADYVPLLGDGVDWTWVVNVIAWLAIFAVGAVWRFSKDTARI
jgi:hypothetical protein